MRKAVENKSNFDFLREVNPDLGEFCSLLLLIGAANLDTLLLALSLTLRRRELTARSQLIIAVLTSVITALSLWAGRSAAGMLREVPARRTAAALMVFLGVREMLHACRSNAEEAPPQPMSWRDSLTLALVLALNNAGLGVAAGLAGCAPLTAGVLNLLAVPLSLSLGSALGKCGRRWTGSRWADICSGAVLLALGAFTGFT